MKRIASYLLAWLMFCACSAPNSEKAGVLPPIYPDYVGVTVPSSIAPLNFEVEGAQKVKVLFQSEGYAFSVSGKYADIPARKWRGLLAGAEGGEITVSVTAMIGDKWLEFEPFKVFVSSDPIDATVVYRRIDPGYEKYAEMGIYQRDLSSFRENPVFKNTKVDPGCVNCHSFAVCNPDKAHLHFRGNKGGTLIRRDGFQTLYNMSNPLTLGVVYPYWHPEGRYLAYSVNDIRQSFHNVPDRVLEVYDLASDVVIFDTEEETINVFPLLQDSSRLETFPAFSPDGKTLYFCSAAVNDDFQQIRYELCSVEFDPVSGSVGDSIRTVWSNPTKSASFPRPSYDGRYLMFTVSDFGNFSIWHKEADLWVYDCRSGEAYPASNLNSSDTESYHSWSTNSKWVVFSSRRDDGRYTRLYLSHCNADGSFSKPFMLPQRNPELNLLLLQSFNIPEFCTGDFSIEKKEVYSEKRKSII